MNDIIKLCWYSREIHFMWGKFENILFLDGIIIGTHRLFFHGISEDFKSIFTIMLNVIPTYGLQEMLDFQDVKQIF